MNIFIKHREWFKTMAIASFVSLNFFMIAACYTQEDGAWAATFVIAAIAIACSLICHFTQGLTSDECKRETDPSLYKLKK
ncbi:MAG: hypothetical protein K2I08_04825 [Muribaculaceae bacterium]|nr:hypothetical protein [Muribaculaceae bacterium]